MSDRSCQRCAPRKYGAKGAVALRLVGGLSAQNAHRYLWWTWVLGHLLCVAGFERASACTEPLPWCLGSGAAGTVEAAVVLDFLCYACSTGASNGARQTSTPAS